MLALLTTLLEVCGLMLLVLAGALWVAAHFGVPAGLAAGGVGLVAASAVLTKGGAS